MKLFLLFGAAIFVASVSCKEDEDKKNAHDDIFDINEKMFKRAKSGVSGFSNKENKKEEEMHEGDIVLTPKLAKFLDDQRDGKETSQFDAAVRGAWPNGRVPYTFARGFRYQSAVRQAVQEYNAKTCIRLVPRTSSDRSYIEFFHGGGCYSMIGRQGGRQQVSLGNGCGTKGVAIHEIMHALGFFHEQSRRDRDSYIRIMWNNIPGRVRYNFEKYKHGQADTLGESYDKKSVMHYGNYAFSTNRQKTIVSISNPNEVLGQRNGLSTIDARQLNKMYKCGGVKPVKPVQPSSCTDKYSLCSTLARERLCTVSVTSWVKTNCKKSCGVCSTKPKPTLLKRCQRHSQSNYCSNWARQGYCSKSSRYYSFMIRTCPQCKQCRN